jgi:23S rRNA pseudouridine1911/1915/1917 synthase
VPQFVTADRGDLGQRLDLVLRRHLTGLKGASRSGVQRWVSEGRVAINGRCTRRPATRLAIGDVITVAELDLPVRQRAQPEALPLAILYEDDELLVVSKPPGIVVHPAYRHPAGTLLNGLLWHARSWPAPARPSIVGRLDKMTSGLVIAAKSPAVHAALQRTLTLAASLKIYLAIVHGHVKPARGLIDLPLARDPGDRRRVTVVPAGAPSQTRYLRVHHSKGLSLMRCELVTGRLHQIRVHLSAQGWPIVGDPVYGTRDSAPIFPRQALHAWRVAFDHPVNGRRVELEAPIPADMLALMAGANLPDPSS